MATRRNFLIGGACFFLSGCMSTKLMTPALYKDKKRIERISCLFISNDKKYILFIGSDYHYIFEAPGRLVNILLSEFKNKIYLTQSKLFTIDGDGNIKGELTLSASGVDTYEEAKMAESYGFVLDDFSYFIDEEVRKKFEKKNLVPSIQQVLPMKGKVYRSGGMPIPDNPLILKNVHVIQVVEPASISENITRLSLTPLTLLYDGVFAIGTIIFSPLLLSPAGPFILMDEK